MQIKMKHLQTFEKYYVDGNTVYHYTSIENAIKILKDGYLKNRRYEAINKYSPKAADDYGYISFTENEVYHEESTEIPSEVRFTFDIDELEKDYDVDEYDANQEALDLYDGDLDDDLQRGNVDHFGEEMELRIYEKDVPIKYIKSLEFVFSDISESEELISLCDQNNIIYREV